MTTDNFCIYLQNRLIQTSQTGGQLYSDTSPFSIPWIIHLGLVRAAWAVRAVWVFEALENFGHFGRNVIKLFTFVIYECS